MISYISHMILHSYEIRVIGLDYDILCDFICFLAPARACSNAAPSLLKIFCPLWLRNQVAVVY